MNVKSAILTSIVILLALIVALVSLFIGFRLRDYQANKFISSPQEILEPEGYYVYYLQKARFYDDELSITSPTGHVTVLDIQTNLTVTVNPEHGGTVLVVKHWAYKMTSRTDSAELIVQTKEQKAEWEKAIKKTLEEYHKKLEMPRDVLPVEAYRRELEVQKDVLPEVRQDVLTSL